MSHHAHPDPMISWCKACQVYTGPSHNCPNSDTEDEDTAMKVHQISVTNGTDKEIHIGSGTFSDKDDDKGVIKFAGSKAPDEDIEGWIVVASKDKPPNSEVVFSGEIVGTRRMYSGARARLECRANPF